MTDVTLRQLEYALAVAEDAHFGRAARRMAVSQPGLSSQIRELERKLGAPLFERTARGVRTTAAGADVAQRARSILNSVNELIEASRLHEGAMCGTVEVAAIPTMAPYLLPSVVSTLTTAWPQATLALREMQTRTMVEAVEAGDVDLGLLALPVDVGSLAALTIATEEFHLALPVGHELDIAGPVDISVLADLPVLLLEDGHCLREHALSACALAGDGARREVKSAGLSTLSQMVAAGLGATLLPTGAVPVEARPGSGIVTRQFVGDAPGRQVAFVWRPTDPRSAWFEEAAMAVGEAISAAQATSQR